MLFIKGGLIYLDGKWEKDLAIAVDGGKILDIVPGDAGFEGQVLDAEGKYISPGFIDIHIHGCAGHDTMEGTVDSLEKMAAFVASHGTTSFLPTTVTAPFDSIQKSVEAVCEGMKKELGGAQILGAHLEGPWISTKAKGAHVEEYIKDPDVEAFRQWPEDLKSAVRLVTMAPELPGAKECIKFLTDRGIVVSIGHTTADYRRCMESFDWGIRHVTHFYNAMAPFKHREPALVGAALDDERVTIELIADLIHVHPAALRLAIKLKGAHRVALITDSMEASGLKDGVYSLGAYKVWVKNGEARLESGTLAGSTLTQDRALRNICSSGISLEDGIRMLTETPARVIRMEDQKGRIKKGLDADLVIMDGDLEVVMTFVKGRKVYSRDENASGMISRTGDS